MESILFFASDDVKCSFLASDEATRDRILENMTGIQMKHLLSLLKSPSAFRRLNKEEKKSKLIKYHNECGLWK